MWLKRILIVASLVLALMIALVLVAGYWTPSGQVEQSISVTVDQHTLTVAGLYKSVTQESVADGVSIKVDGHGHHAQRRSAHRRRQDANAGGRPGCRDRCG
jgi:hypothetical protein